MVSKATCGRQRAIGKGVNGGCPWYREREQRHVQLDGVYGTGNNGQDEISVSYVPGKITCTDIRFVQSTKTVGLAVDANGHHVRMGENDNEIRDDPKKNPYGFARRDWVTIPGGVSAYVDRLKCEKDPFYNPAAHAGSAPPPTKSTMTDAPSSGLPGVKADVIIVLEIFETCAVCVDTGLRLDCFAWVCTHTRANRGTINVVNPNGGASFPPTDSWQDALKKSYAIIPARIRRGRYSGIVRKQGKRTARSHAPSGKLCHPGIRSTADTGFHVASQGSSCAASP